MFQMGGVGPMFGQYNHFANYAVDKIPYAIDRYTNEVARLHRVLDKRLAEVTWLAGDEYSMADIITFPWIRNPERRNIDLATYPNVKRWHDADGRPAGGAARRRRAGGPPAQGLDDRRRARGHVRQDPVRGALTAARQPSAAGPEAKPHAVCQRTVAAACSTEAVAAPFGLPRPVHASQPGLAA